MKNKCFHCGLSCDNEDIIYKEKHFCCVGCKTVFDIITLNNLDTYYQINNTPGSNIKSSKSDKYNFLDSDKINKKIIEFSDGGINIVNFHIPIIHCSSCIYLLENLHKLFPDKISNCIVDFTKKRARISYFNEKISLGELAYLLSKIGYSPHISLESISENEKNQDKSSKELLYKLGVAGFCFGNIMLMAFPEYFDKTDFWIEKYKPFFRWFMLFFSLPVVFYSASDYLISAYKGIKHKIFSVDLPISIGIFTLFLKSCYDVISATDSGYFDSLAGFIFFLLLGKFFQEKTYKSLSFDRDYKSYYPISVSRKTDKNTEEVILLSEIKKDDIIVVRNDEIIPMDGILTKGKALIDNSFITGESNFIPKELNDKIYAGGRQKGSSINIKVTKEVSQSYLTKLWNNDIFKKEKTPIKKTIDKVSKYFTITLLLIAILSGIFWYFKDSSQIIEIVTAVLIVACPCALALSSPFTFGNMMRIFSQRKIFVKNAETIEKIAKINYIVFDKTGTITTNEKSKISYNGKELSDRELDIVKSVIQSSNHPLSRMLFSHLKDNSVLEITDFEEIIGQGLSAKYNDIAIRIGSEKFIENTNNSTQSRVYISIDNEIKGYFTFANNYRKGLLEFVKNTQNKISVITGDNDGEREKLREIFPKNTKLEFNKSPEEKLNYIKKLQQKGYKVMMIGDGLNDAGALKQSDVGVSISESNNNFSPSCDAIIDSDSFDKISNFIESSKLSIKIIYASFFLSILYNIIGLSFAITGNLSPVIAAILMPLSSISIVIFTTIMTSIVAYFKFK